MNSLFKGHFIYFFIAVPILVLAIFTILSLFSRTSGQVTQGNYSNEIITQVYTGTSIKKSSIDSIELFNDSSVKRVGKREYVLNKYFEQNIYLIHTLFFLLA